MSEQVQVLHHIPGRIRIKVPYLKDKPEACKTIDDMAVAIHAVHCIKAHPVTGSVLVHYDKADPDVMPRLEQALEQLENFLSFIEPNAGEAGDTGDLGKPNTDRTGSKGRASAARVYSHHRQVGPANPAGKPRRRESFNRAPAVAYRCPGVSGWQVVPHAAGRPADDVVSVLLDAASGGVGKSMSQPT
jgi:hypothetical protein